MNTGTKSKNNTHKTKKNTEVPWYRNWLMKNVYMAVIALSLVVFLLFSALAHAVVAVFDGNNTAEMMISGVSKCALAVIGFSRTADEASLRLEVTDSVYITRMAPGAVYKQNPVAGSKVKKNRRILLTINAKAPKTVKMPSLVGFSLRQAQAELTASQLKVGKLIYVEDLATNNVLDQKYKGTPVAAGSPVPGESEIDLVLGMNPEDGQTYIPDLTATPYPLIKEKLTDNSVNLGKVVFDGTVHTYSDSLEAIVYKQTPVPADTTVAMGSPVTVYLTKDKSLIRDAGK